MIGIAMLPITWSGGSTTPCGRLASTRSSGTKTSSSTTSLLAVPRMPSVFQLSSTLDALGRERHGQVEDPQALLGVVVRRHRRHHGADGRLAGEPLVGRDPEAAVDADGLAARVGPVAPAGRHQDDALVGHPAQGRLGAGHARAGSATR